MPCARQAAWPLAAFSHPSLHQPLERPSRLYHQLPSRAKQRRKRPNEHRAARERVGSAGLTRRRDEASQTPQISPWAEATDRPARHVQPLQVAGPARSQLQLSESSSWFPLRGFFISVLLSSLNADQRVSSYRGPAEAAWVGSKTLLARYREPPAKSTVFAAQAMPRLVAHCSHSQSSRRLCFRIRPAPAAAIRSPQMG